MKSLRSYLQGIVKRTRTVLTKIYHARGSDHEIALGASIGAFWGVFPTFGLSTILTLLLYRVFRFNVLVAISAAFISNPLTSPFWLISAYEVGAYLLNTHVEFNMETWKENLSQVGHALFLGSGLISTTTAVIVYFITKYFVRRRRKRKTNPSTAQNKK